MENEDPNNINITAITAVKKAQNATESVAKVADSANSAFSAIKWVAIAVVLLIVMFVGWTGYKVISAPAKAVGSAVESVSDTVKSGANSVKDGTSDIINRLKIETTDQAVLNARAEAAFQSLSDMKPVIADGMKSRVYNRANFPGHENKVCEVFVKFGTKEIPVLIANDNKSYATSKSLGSKKDRKTRLVIRAEGDDIPLNIKWNEDTKNWGMGWKRSTLSKPLSDIEAEERLLAILETAAKTCR